MYLSKGTLLQDGKYRIESVLGRGGFGITYLAVQTNANRCVAIKEFFMREHCNRDKDFSDVKVPSVGSRELVDRFKEKFIKEACTIAALSHPNIIKIYDIFQERGTAYYVMEYHPNGTLESLMLPLKTGTAISYVKQIGSALSYLHKHNIMHLDVKPGNVVLNESGCAVLIDFGVSKHYDKIDGLQTTSTPVGVSNGFAPLEQYNSGGVSTFTPATDIYSLGATLYKLVVGTTPPIANVINENGFPKLPSHLPAALCSAIEKAMQPRRKDRHNSIDEFMAMLEEPEETPAIKAAAVVVKNDAPESTIIVESNDDKSPDQDHKKLRLPKNKFHLVPLIAGFILALSILLILIWPSEEGVSESPVSIMPPANCFIVSSSGTYSFKAVQGNSTTPVGDVASVEVLWESFGTSEVPAYQSLIRLVWHDEDVITFKTNSSFRKGNAVIAAKNKYGKILWSWHIWFTDPPKEQRYYYNAGVMMDRNLGATSSYRGSVGALGLLYQWGRKDPFLGSSSISSSIPAESTINWPSPLLTNRYNGTVDYTIANPTTYLCNPNPPSDWHYSYRNDDLWASWKTKYDPCPFGWRVPDGGDAGVWISALGSDDMFWAERDNQNIGIDFSGIFGSDAIIWYPAQGCRNDTDGKLDLVSSYGYTWSATTSGSKVYHLRFNKRGQVYPGYKHDRADGFAVRCVKE